MNMTMLPPSERITLKNATRMVKAEKVGLCTHGDILKQVETRLAYLACNGGTRSEEEMQAMSDLIWHVRVSENIK